MKHLVSTPAIVISLLFGAAQAMDIAGSCTEIRYEDLLKWNIDVAVLANDTSELEKILTMKKNLRYMYLMKDAVLYSPLFYVRLSAYNQGNLFDKWQIIIQITDLLLKCDADINMRNTSIRNKSIGAVCDFIEGTVLHGLFNCIGAISWSMAADKVAYKEALIKVVHYLLANKADPNIKNVNSKTALDIAIEKTNNDPDVVKILRDHGAKTGPELKELEEGYKKILFSDKRNDTLLNWLPRELRVELCGHLE